MKHPMIERDVRQPDSCHNRRAIVHGTIRIGKRFLGKTAVDAHNEAKEFRTMSQNRSEAGLAVVGRLSEGYIILCKHNGDEYSFLVKSLGISVECPHCGATRCGPELAADSYFETTAANDDGSAASVRARPRTRIERAAAE
jgi:hypothetical protein